MLRRIALIACATALSVGQYVSSAPTSWADANTGLCGTGSALARYTTEEPAYNALGELMWRAYYTKKWCYTYSRHAVTSWTARVSVSFYNGYGSVWSYVGINNADHYYSSRNARGVATPYPQFSHVSWAQIHMKHCTFLSNVVPLFCDDQYYHLGIRSFSDGSKKLA